MIPVHVSNGFSYVVIFVANGKLRYMSPLSSIPSPKVMSPRTSLTIVHERKQSSIQEHSVGSLHHVSPVKFLTAKEQQ